MRIPLILDTDIGTDADDALALAYALRHPDIDLRAVTTVSGDPVVRARIARKLLIAADRDDVPVAAGLSSEAPPGHSPWLGHEGKGLLQPADHQDPIDLDAVDLLHETARRTSQEGRRVIVAIIGMHTNLAAALRKYADLADQISRLAVMGGVFSPAIAASRQLTPDDDHNLRVDPEAAVQVLNAGIPILYTPLNVTSQTLLTRQQLERLRAGDSLCQAVASLIDVWTPVLHGRSPGPPPEQVVALHDPLTVASLVNQDFITVQRLPVTATLVEGVVHTFVDPVAGTPADVITAVSAEDFAEHLLDVIGN
jgi:inosine-uridine nucleoside N-ribohydrolase